jgi:multicomponent Na+:H+ antiporter subunit B
VFQRSLIGVVVLTTIYSFLMASVLIVLDAVDVAMTEASVGAGISTVILLATLHLVRTTEMRTTRSHPAALLLAIGTGTVLIWGTLALPPFGTADMIINKHVVPRYLNETIRETNVPNVVTSVLADYRGYDTLGETTVIFTAGIGVMLLLRGARRKGRKDVEGGPT